MKSSLKVIMTLAAAGLGYWLSKSIRHAFRKAGPDSPSSAPFEGDLEAAAKPIAERMEHKMGRGATLAEYLVKQEGLH